MSDNEDPNSRRPARPSTPPFRGPASPAGGKPPLTPPGGGSRAVSSPSKAGQPFIPPGAARRPATPAKGGAPPQPAAPPRPVTPPASPRNETPAYGSAPPASVAKTLQSIAEFTIVEATEQDAHAAGAESERRAYEAPRLTPANEQSHGTSEGASTSDAVDMGRRSATEEHVDGGPITAAPDELDEMQPVESDLTPGSSTVEGGIDWNGAQSEGAADEGAVADSAIGDAGTATAAFDVDARSSDRAESNTEHQSGEWSASTEQDSEPADWRSQHAPPLGEAFGGSSRTEEERIAACLEDVARRVREGGLRVQGPGDASGQPAVLAAVLAAMLRRGE